MICITLPYSGSTLCLTNNKTKPKTEVNAARFWPEQQNLLVYLQPTEETAILIFGEQSDIRQCFVPFSSFCF